jgi:hydroxyethylthiazole kinase-like uncharacterized protein yjeF
MVDGPMPIWDHLSSRLAELASTAPPPPTGGRNGAALALLRDVGDGGWELLLTRRRDDLRTHPGQISFPGGRVDEGESAAEAAVREAAEECALDPSSVTVLGALPAFYIPPSRFWLQVVVARWDEPHPLVPAEAEVAEILVVRSGELRDPSRWRVARLSARAASWAWDLGAGRVLWGATAIATAVLLGLLDPDWAGGTDPARLPPEREVRPWEDLPAAVHRGGPRLDVPSRDPGQLAGPPSLDDAAALVARAGSVVAEAVETLGDGGSVVVLVGPGWTGTVGMAASARLVERGVDVAVVTVEGEASATGSPVRAGLAAELGERVEMLGGDLPAGSLVLDAVTGRGLDGPLRPPLLDLVLALRTTAAPVISVDLPSGVHPERGLVGDAASADVTLALGAPAPGLFATGIAPFVGELYLVELGEEAAVEPLVRLVPERQPSGWRE